MERGGKGCRLLLGRFEARRLLFRRDDGVGEEGGDRGLGDEGGVGVLQRKRAAIYFYWTLTHSVIICVECRLVEGSSNDSDLEALGRGEDAGLPWAMSAAALRNKPAAYR